MPTPAKMPDLEEYLFPWEGVAMNEYIIRNLSKTLREIAEATTKPKTNQEKNSLNSFARVMLDRTALDHTLA